MAGRYENPITIADAIAAIHERAYLLPAIQRKFVWSTGKICALFDSIMRGYPINTFMFWKVQSAELKKSYKFYDFLKSYCQRFEEENPSIPVKGDTQDFFAVIDGQQRLTSLYIGLCGTYAYKQPRMWWPKANDPKILPPRKLYLDLAERLDPRADNALMVYNFRFLTDEQHQRASKSGEPNRWLCMHDVLNFPKLRLDEVLLEIVEPELSKRGLADNTFAKKALLRVYQVIRSEEIIHYFLEPSQDVDRVLDVFIKTNSGGEPLAFSDLLMSIAVANWDGDFRQEVGDLTQSLLQEMGFHIDRDWILKTCLMLTESDVGFKVQNFNAKKVKQIQGEWQDIQSCIKETFRLVRRFGINAESLVSGNAVIPICYYLYKHHFNGRPLYEAVNSSPHVKEQRAKISQWFYMALLKGVFGGMADTILASMRDVLKRNLKDVSFPLGKIIERYQGTNKDLRFDDEYIESLLDVQHGEGRCRVLLHLLFPEMNPDHVFHIDHLHPKSAFSKRLLGQWDFLQADKALLEFFADPSHWNSVANLHLLDEHQNLSKQDSALDEWVESEDIATGDLLLDGVNLSLSAFKEFYQERRARLKKRLKARVFTVQSISREPVDQEDPDEQVDPES